MKKIAFLLFTALTLSFASQAQIGVKLGANLSNLAGDLQDEDNFQNKLGFVGGITYNIPLSSDNFVSIQPELLYSQKGYKRSDFTTTNAATGQQLRYEGKVNYSYLDLPILLKINAGPVFFEAGPQFSYLLSIKDNTEVTDVASGIDFESYNRIDKDPLAEFEVGYAAGVGVQIPLGLTLNVRYNGSVSALAKDDNRDELANGRHSVYQATLGFKLPMGNK
ncbi:PorT family protein [Adhaeribacter swui]|uniref:PorT family protein n=1 Tax=Adhaeribacter swui TaxID=2086471 RepID=A0A7G7G4E4_9BACT|nr:porin family protein [Adhaeribacter swui]QNF32028.1 PorT family protein [Adhaeribacter swui]